MEKYIQVIADTQCTDKCLVFCMSLDLLQKGMCSWCQGLGCFFLFKSQETESKKKLKKE